MNGLTSTEMGASWLLPRLIGVARSNDLLLTGRVVDAAEALAMGLVSRVLPDDELLDACLDVAESMSRFSPYGLAMTKDVLWANLEVASLEAAVELEDRNQLMLGFTENLPEAIRAFDAGRDARVHRRARRGMFPEWRCPVPRPRSGHSRARKAPRPGRVEEGGGLVDAARGPAPRRGRRSRPVPPRYGGPPPPACRCRAARSHSAWAWSSAGVRQLVDRHLAGDVLGAQPVERVPTALVLAVGAHPLVHGRSANPPSWWRSRRPGRGLRGRRGRERRGPSEPPPWRAGRERRRPPRAPAVEQRRVGRARGSATSTRDRRRPRRGVRPARVGPLGQPERQVVEELVGDDDARAGDPWRLAQADDDRPGGRSCDGLSSSGSGKRGEGRGRVSSASRSAWVARWTGEGSTST